MTAHSTLRPDGGAAPAGGAPALFDLADLQPAEPENPQTLRAALAAGIIRQLRADAARMEEDIRDHWPHIPAQAAASEDPGDPWRTWYWSVQLRAVISWLERDFIQTHEEYLHANAKRSGTTVTEADVECARHRDHCPCCVSLPEIMAKLSAERDRAEKGRRLYVEGLAQIDAILDQAAEKDRDGEPHQLTFEHVREWLAKVGEKAHGAWSVKP